MTLQIALARDWVLALLLLSMRIAPVLAFAPPLSLLRLPRSVRAAAGLALALALEPAARPAVQALAPDGATLALAAAGELLAGGLMAFALQTAFAAFHVAGRLLELQSGLSMATALDPSRGGHAPLLGLLLGWVAGAVFLATGGHHELMRVAAAGLRALPPGALAAAPTPQALLAQMGAMGLLAISAAGLAMVVLFAADVALAAMTRSMPQMNVLVLGMQVKGVLLLLALAAGAGAIAPLTLEATAQAFSFIARALGR